MAAVLILGELIRRITSSRLQELLERLGIYQALVEWWPIIQILSVVISILLLIGIFYCRRKIIEIREEEKKELYPSEEEVPAGLPGEADVLPGADTAQSRWQQVLAHVDADSPSDWRQAIIEADIMLDDMLGVMPYEGDSVGEKLKQASKAEFTTLDKAWEAHKVRNAVAHEGASYRITQREARRVIDLFRQVFQEFNYI